MIRIIFVLGCTFLLSACETTRETKTNNIGANSSSVPIKAGFDKEKAAAVRVSTGLTYLNRENYTRAKFHLDKALEYDPDSGDVHYSLGIYFQRVKEHSKAKAHFEEALDIERKNPRYMNAYGAFLCEAGNFEKAEKMFNQAIAIPTYSDAAFALFNIGFCALKQDNVEKAESFFRKALNRNAKMTAALIEMAKIEYNKKRYNRAMNYLKRYESYSNVSSESAWLGLRIAKVLKNNDSVARYSTLLEQRFPDSEETAIYLDEKL